jgi:hypothetical protein
VIIFSGIPNLDIHLLKKASATVSVDISGNGMTFVQLVHLSIQVKQYLLPLTYGNGPIRSI